MNEMTIGRRTQADLQAVLDRDEADRAGKDRRLLLAVQKTEVRGRMTPEYSVVFLFADGPITAFDGLRWESWCTKQTALPPKA